MIDRLLISLVCVCVYSKYTTEDSFETFLKEHLSSLKGDYKKHFKSVIRPSSAWLDLEYMLKNYLSQQNPNMYLLC